MKNLDSIIRQQNPSVVTIRNLNEFKDIEGNDVVVDMETAQAEYDAQEYARNRASEYPSLLELTVALYDTDDKSAVEAKRASVKLKYPKPE